MQLQELLQLAVAKLRTTTKTPHLEADLLLGQVLGLKRVQLILNPTQIILPIQEQEFLQLLAKRLQGMPIAYLLGQQEFWSLLLEVTPATLIPRPETELLVELTLQKFPPTKVIKIADLGTGSGAIALAIAHERPHWQVVATDNSTAALEVANRNARNLAITNVTFHCGDWSECLADQVFDAIVSNPPYIAADDPHLQQGDVRFEPITALVGGTDGLRDLSSIITQAKQYLMPKGWLMLEHGYDQAERVEVLLQERGYSAINTHQDLAGWPRVTIGQRN